MKIMKTADWLIAKTDAYGGVLLTRHGQLLLREPANHFDGYVWTFAKGKLDEGETPEQTALREVLEETGYQAEVVDVLPGVFHSGFSASGYFIMRHLGRPGNHDWETQATRWVDFETAATLIEQTTNAKGRARDLAVLKAARAWFDANLTVVLPDHERDTAMPAKKSDWNVQGMPPRFVTLSLDFTLDAKETVAVRRGFIPSAMEEKWFSYFENNILFQHRSWSGYCIDQIHFDAEGFGLRATHAEVNREIAQYQNTDDREDTRRIEVMVRQLGGGATETVGPSSLLAAIELANQPNYLGNIQVVSTLVQQFLHVHLDALAEDASYSDKLKANQYLTQVMTEDGLGYTRMPGWHIETGLGQAVMQYFELNKDYCEGENLAFLVSESLAAVSLAVQGLSQQWQAAQEAEEDYNLVERLVLLRDFVASVLHGSNTVYFPDQVLSDLVDTNCDELAGDAGDELPEEEWLEDEETLPVKPAVSNFDALLKSLNVITKHRLPPFQLAAIGIVPGTVLTFKLDPTMTCVVTEGNRVQFQDETMSTSKAAVLALQKFGRKVTTARGPDYWTLNGESLTHLRTKK